jgi:hypothetical protein
MTVFLLFHSHLKQSQHGYFFHSPPFIEKTNYILTLSQKFKIPVTILLLFFSFFFIEQNILALSYSSAILNN